VGITQKFGVNRPRIFTKRLKNVFLSGSGKKIRMQRGLSATYPARISTIFEMTDVNRCSGGDRREKFPNFFTGRLQAQKRNFGV